jgi:glutathione S-transferase
MITVFGGWPTRSQRVLWLLEELGLTYDFRQVDLRKRREDSEFLSVNPAGFLPAVRDGDTDLVESVAIMEYILAKNPSILRPSPDDPAFGSYLMFLHLGEAGLAALLNVVVVSRIFAPAAEKVNFGSEAAVGLFFNRLSLVSVRLESNPYLAGQNFTAADISVAYALELGERMGLKDRYESVLVEYMGRLSERAAYRRALEKSPPQPLPN